MVNTFSYDSQMIDECLMTTGIAVSTDQTSPLAVFQNQNGEGEVLVIHQDTELYHVVREPLSKSGWNMYGVGAQLASAAIVNASIVYAIGNNDVPDMLHTLNNGLWDVAAVQFTAESLFSGWDGTIWAFFNDGSNNNIWQLTGGNWQLAQAFSSGAPNVQNIAGSNGNFWYVDIEGNVTNFSDNPQSPPSYNNQRGGSVIAVVQTPDGKLWMFDSFDTLYEAQNQQWIPASNSPGGFNWLASDANGTLWGIYQPRHYTSTVLGYLNQQGVWEQATAPPTTLGSVASIGQDGSVLVLDIYGVAWILVGGPSGSWQRQMTPTGLHGFTVNGQVTEVVTGQDAQQVWRAFFVQAGNLYQMNYQDNGIWTILDNGITAVDGNIGLTNDQQGGALIGYGVSANGEFLVFQDGGQGTYQSNTYQANISLSGVVTNLTVIGQMWITTAVIDNTLAQIWGTPGEPMIYTGTGLVGPFPVTEPNSNNVPPNMKQVVRLPWVQAEASLPYTVVLDNDGNLYMVFQLSQAADEQGVLVSSGNYVQIAGAGVSALSSITDAGAIIDSTGMARIYAADSSYRVWVIRQTGSSGNNGDPWTWSQWHPLGDNCLYLANGPGALQTTELFTISAENLLYVIDQDAVTQQWNSSLIKRPADTGEDFDELTLYKTEVAVLDDNGAPAPDVQVNIQASEPALLWVEGVQHTLDAGQSVTGTTNAMGKVRITTPATGLHTSPLSISLSGQGSTQTVYAPQRVHDFLAGKISLGVAGRIFTADGSALVNATDYNGNPFAPFSGMAQNPNVPAAAAVIMKLAQVQPSNPTLTAPARLKAVNNSAALGQSFWDNLWNDMVNYAGDVFHAISNGMLKVYEVILDAFEEVIEVTIQIVGDVEQRVFQFAVSTYQDIANGVQTGFQWLGAEVNAVINWLKAELNWTAIQNTQQVFAYFLGQSIPWMQNEVGQGGILVNNFFQNLEGDVTQWFEWLKTYLGGQTMDQFADNASTQSQINFNGVQFPAGICQFGTEVNWLLDKVESYIFGPSNESLNPVTVVQQAAQTFWQFAQPAWSDLDQAIGDFKNFVMGQVKQPGDFKQMMAADLINGVEKVILAALQFADAVVQAFLKLVEAALGYVNEVLTYPINIPLLSKVFEQYVGQPLTALNLFTTLLAVPVTVSYKLVTGKAQLFTNQMVAEITNGHSPEAGMAGAPAVDPAVQTAFYWCSGAVNLIWAGFDTALDAYQSTPPLGLQILDIIFPTVLQVLEWPSGEPFTRIPLDTPAHRWGFGNWMIGWVPIPLNIALLLIGNKLSADTSRVARYSDPVGKGILTGLGLVNLGVGAAASGLGHKDGSVNAGGIVANSLSPMSNLFQWLRVESLEKSSEEVSYFIKLLIDFFLGAGTAVALFAEGMQTSEA